jgi:hypothetical protein
MKENLILLLASITIITLYCINNNNNNNNNNSETLIPTSLNDNYIFSKIILDNKLILIFPIYDNEISLKEFHVELDSLELKLIKEIKKIENEPIHIFIYEINEELDMTDIVTGTFKYNNFKENLLLYPKFTTKKYNFGITTLFKDDYKLFPIFYDYYTRQGVEIFYMYYNGISTKEIKQIFNKSNVILIDWNYRYWNPKNIKYRHHAQIGQIHDSLYRYAKPECEYIIYCDLDEYLYIPNNNLNEYINKHNDTDVFEFNNYFAETLTNNIPETLPNRLKIGDKHDYTVRSKNIYKSINIDSINIHFPYKFNIDNPRKSKEHIMLHFQSWSGRRPEVNNLIELKKFN